MDSIPALITYVSADRRYRIVNSTFENWWKLPRSELIGKTLEEILGSEISSRLAPYVDAALSGEEVSYEEEMDYPDGFRRWISAEYVPHFGDDNKVLGYFALVQDISERKRTEQTLKESEQRFRHFAETSSDWFWETDANLRFTLLSERYSELTGIARENVLGKTRAEARAEGLLVNPAAVTDDPDGWRTHQRDLDERKPYRDFEMEWVAADGSRVVCRTSDIPFFDEAGEFKGYRGTGVNITARRRDEDELRLRDRALEALREGVIISDLQQPDNPIIYANSAFETLTGYSRAEVLGRNCRFLQGEDREQPARRTLGATIKAGGSIETSIRNYRKDGSPFTNRLRLAPIRDAQGKVTHYVGVQANITEQVEAEQSLRASEESLAEAQKIDHIGHWSYDIEAGTLQWSDEVYRIFGWEPDAAEMFADRFYSTIHPDHRGQVIQARDLATSGAGPQRVEYRVIRPNGVVCWVNQEMVVDLVGDGKPSHIKGVVQDISERKQAELALLDSEQRFRDFASASADWYWETDTAQNYTWLSRAGEEAFSGDLGRYKGKSRLIPRENKENEAGMAEHMRALAAREPFRDLVMLTTLISGEKRWISASGVPVFDPDGDFLGYRGATRNIHQEVEARSAAERLVQALDSLEDSVALYDADDRLILSNRMHRKYSPGSEKFLAAHPTYQELLHVVVDSGLLPVNTESIEDFLARRLSAHHEPRGSFKERRTDGVTVEIAEHRLNDGGTIFVARDITQQEQAARALAESEQRFRDFASAGSDRFWETDARHRFTYIGGGDSEDFIWAETEAIGKNPWENDGGDPERNDIWLETKHLLHAQQPFRDLQIVAVAPNGAARHLRANGKPIFNKTGGFAGFRGTITNITDDVMARRAVERAAEVLVNAIEIIPTAVCYFDADDHLIYMNAHFRELTGGLSIDDLKGQTFAELVSARVGEGRMSDAVGHSQDWIKTRTAYHRNPQGTFRLYYNIDGGRSYDLHELRTPDGGTLGIYWDVTETIEQEERLRRAQRMEAMGTLVGGLAHEMNNLLQPICGLADVALRDPTNPDTIDLALRGILKSGTEANVLLQGLLAFGRREQAGKESTDLNKALGNALQIVGPSLPPTIRINTRIDPEIGQAWISGTEFLQVVMNLARNASDAMEGTGTIAISLQHRAPAGQGSGAEASAPPQAVLTITDNGPGLPDDKLHKIFEPFYTSKGVGDGTGLGLAIVHNIVTDWHGQIRAGNTDAGGGEFEILIPLAEKELIDDGALAVAKCGML
ncbi:MAG: PAS domain S-box protein [Alphaproteobacteria bacterium]|nr:PAS domain S-box protein [Alphaproteobacteria bacterium]